jgi:hypothetical protein
MSSKIKDQVIIGIEFLGFTHWDRYLLNEGISAIEKQLFPEASREEIAKQSNEIWRGNRREHYRIDLQKIALNVELDFRPSIFKIYEAKILNLSPSGCRILLPPDEFMDKNQKISKITIKFAEGDLVLKGKVVYTEVNGRESLSKGI